jgi:hypothetical protein
VVVHRCAVVLQLSWAGPVQALARIPETLVCAMEFINLPTPPVRCLDVPPVPTAVCFR